MLFGEILHETMTTVRLAVANYGDARAFGITGVVELDKRRVRIFRRNIKARPPRQWDQIEVPPTTLARLAKHSPPTCD